MLFVSGAGIRCFLGSLYLGLLFELSRNLSKRALLVAMSGLYTPEKSKKYFCIVNVSVKVNPTCNAKPKVHKQLHKDYITS